MIIRALKCNDTYNEYDDVHKKSGMGDLIFVRSIIMNITFPKNKSLSL